MSSARRQIATGLVAAGACAWALGAAAQDGELQQHWARWRTEGPASYVYGYNKYCDCHPTDPPETVVTVANGAVTRVYHLHADSAREVPAREGSLDLYWTIEDLFELLESAFQRGAVVRARYDDALGYPLSLFIDYDSDLVGDEVDLRITRFEPLER